MNNISSRKEIEKNYSFLSLQKNHRFKSASIKKKKILSNLFESSPLKSIEDAPNQIASLHNILSENSQKAFRLPKNN